MRKFLIRWWLTGRATQDKYRAEVREWNRKRLDWFAYLSR